MTRWTSGRRISARRPRSSACRRRRGSSTTRRCRSQQRLAVTSALLESRIEPRRCGSSRCSWSAAVRPCSRGSRDEFTRQLNRHRGIVVATVTSAVPLTDDEMNEIRSRVEAMAGSQVDLRHRGRPGDHRRPDDPGRRPAPRRFDPRPPRAAPRPAAHRGATPLAPAPTETPWPSGPTRSSASSRARSSRSTRRPRRAASAPSSRSATASRRSTGSTPRSRPSCSSSPTG